MVSATVAPPAAVTRHAKAAINAPAAVNFTLIRGSTTRQIAWIPAIPAATTTDKAVASVDRSSPERKVSGVTDADATRSRWRCPTDVLPPAAEATAVAATVARSNRRADAKVLVNAELPNRLAVAKEHATVDSQNRRVDARGRARAGATNPVVVSSHPVAATDPAAALAVPP